MTDKTPKAFDFGPEPEPPPPAPASGAPTPKALDFGVEEAAAPASVAPPKVLSFDDVPAAPASAVPPKVAPRPLFDSEDHPAVRDALASVRAEHPTVFANAEQRLAALFRRILPVKLSLVTDWGEASLMEQAALLQPITELVRTFSLLEVPALISAALDSGKPPAGVLGKLFNRQAPPASYKPRLLDARSQLQQLMQDSELAMRNLDQSARELTLHWVVLATVYDLTGRGPDATLLDVLLQRRSLIQQAVRQAELSVLQMGQVRQQAAELIGQLSSILTVTLPALEMAHAQKER